MEICSIIIFFGICLTFNLVIPQDRLMSYVFFFLLRIPVLSFHASGSCDMMKRIKNRDAGMNVTATESPCRMIVKSSDHRQVVAVIYNFQRNCIGSGIMTISDGSLNNNTVLNRMCRATNLSFISRNHGLIITLTSPFQPFDIDLYLVETEIVYKSQQGTIVSPRYPGSDGGYTSTTPNNYHGIHRIVSVYNVSMYVIFTEFRVRTQSGGESSTCSNDVVKVLRDSSLKSEYCGDGILPNPVNVIAKEITLEYITDDFATYTGFTATYSVCMKEVNGTIPKGAIDFPMFPSIKRTCMFVIKLPRQGKIRLELELSPQRNCSHSVKITVDDKFDRPATCDEILEVNAIEVEIAFNLENGESFKGNYSIDYTSTEQGTVEGEEGSSPPSNDKTANQVQNMSTSSLIIGVVVCIIVVIAVVIFVIIFCKRRKNIKNREVERRMENMSGNVYEDKEDYDHLNVKRDHKRTSNDQNSNVYGRMIPSEANNEYAVANKNGQAPEVISANQYGTGAFGTEYEEAVIPTSNQKEIDQNLYE